MLKENIHLTPACARDNWRTGTGLSETWLETWLAAHLPADTDVHIKAAQPHQIDLDISITHEAGSLNARTAIYPFNQCAHIEHLSISGELKGKKLGTAVACSIAALAHDIHLSEISVTAGLENGCSFWPSLGFFFQDRAFMASTARIRFNTIAARLPAGYRQQMEKLIEEDKPESLCLLARESFKIDDQPLNHLLFQAITHNCYLELDNRVQARLFQQKTGLNFMA